MELTYMLINRWLDSQDVAHIHNGAPKSLQIVIAAVKLKDAYSLEGKLWPTQIAY